MPAVIYSPGSDAGEQTPEQAKPAAEAPKTEDTPKPAEAKPSLADEIRADRERRMAQAKAAEEESSAKKELEAARARLDKYEKSKDNALLDSTGFLKEMGMTPQEMASFAENVMFTLVPEKAPVDFRQRMLEAQYARDKQLAETRRAEEAAKAEKAAQERAAAEGARMEEEFKEALANAVPSFTAETHPASVAWFGQDHRDYAESLLHTARNLAEEATRAGRLADLSPGNIAAVLEKSIADRAARFKTPTQSQSAPVSKQSPATEKQSVQEDKSQETNPQPGAYPDDAERIRRAAAVVFRD